MRTVASAAAWMAAGAVAATVLTGVAVAASQPQQAPGIPALSASAGTADGDDATGPRGRKMLRDVLHGSLTVDTGSGTAVVDVQRGELTAASATSITVRSTDGYTATYALDGDTKVRRDRADAEPSGLAVGDTVMVRATAGTADVVRALSPEALADLQQRRESGGLGGMRSGTAGMGGSGGMGGTGGMGMGWDA